MPVSSPLIAAKSCRTQSGRILFALSHAEWRLFFPHDIDLSRFEVSKYCGDADSLEKMLRERRPEVLVTSWSTPPLKPEWLDEMPFLRYICHTSGSVRQIVPRAFLEKGGIVSNWGTLAAKGVAEHALLLTLAGLRCLEEWPPVIAGKRPWHPSPILTRTLYGKRVGLHGFGNVARALVALLQPFGASIAAFSVGVPKEIYTRHGVTLRGSLGELFESSDILVECEALHPHNVGIVTRSLLQKLPQGALFVNVARGALVDESALADLAQNGHLRLALDVFATDPIASDSPLHKVDTRVFSPHIAGPTSDQFVFCGELIDRNLKAYFNGQPLEAVVTLEMYDRAT